MLVILALLLLSSNFATSLIAPHFLAITEFIDRAHALGIELSDTPLDSAAVASNIFATGDDEVSHTENSYQVSETLNEDADKDTVVSGESVFAASSERNETEPVEALEELSTEPYRQPHPSGHFNLGSDRHETFWQTAPQYAPFSDSRMRYPEERYTFFPENRQFGFSQSFGGSEFQEPFRSPFTRLPESEGVPRRMMASAARYHPHFQAPHRSRYIHRGQPRLPPGPLPPRPSSRGPARHRPVPFHPRFNPPSNLRARHVPFRTHPPHPVQRHLGPGLRNIPFRGPPPVLFTPTPIVPKVPAKPLYRYPSDAMSIQDIIRYMDGYSKDKESNARSSRPDEDFAEVIGMKSNPAFRTRVSQSREPTAARMDVHTDLWTLNTKPNNRDEQEEYYARPYGLDTPSSRSAYEDEPALSGSSALNHKPHKVVLHLNLYPKNPSTRQNLRQVDRKFSSADGAASSSQDHYYETSDYYPEDSQAAESNISTDQDDLLKNHQLSENHGRNRPRNRLNTHFASRNDEPERNAPYALWLTQEKTTEKKKDNAITGI